MNNAKTLEIVREGLKLAKELTPDNREYYDDFITYVRINTNFSGDESIEPLLLEILQDLLQAQNDGLSAKEYFGSNPTK